MLRHRTRPSKGIRPRYVVDLALRASTAELFGAQVRRAIANVQHLPAEHQIVFVKSWNEWAAGNHLEPGMRYGHGYRDVLRRELTSRQ